jgi:DNA ligase-1
MKREFLQLAHTYNPAKHKIAGFVISEKLDGTRCFWDGGITRGMKTEQVPWAGVTDPKTGKRKPKLKPTATGLWSRYGNPIIAPDDFLNALPACPLDGELWAGRGNFQLCRSICAGDSPDPRFSQIQFAVYSTPPLGAVFQSGEINSPNMRLTMDLDALEPWLADHLMPGYSYLGAGSTFNDELLFLKRNLETQNDVVFPHRQIRLPNEEADAKTFVEEFLQTVLDKGGEGVVIRDPQSGWRPKRHKGLLKYKPFDDAEAVLVGFTSGQKTDKGSRLLGKIGALIVDYDGKRLELSGMTDPEREFLQPKEIEYAVEHPGEDMPADFAAVHFTVGDRITFKYRELTDDGIPKEARYWRRRDEE